MESAALSERIAFEARRVAVALGLKDWADRQDRREWTVFSFDTEDMSFSCHFNLQGQVDCIAIDGPQGTCEIERYSTGQWLLNDNGHEDLMARALYRLHFDDADIIAQLPSLTAHETLELRLSMPREFWPQCWIDELS